MILDGEEREPLVSHPLRRVIIEIDLGQFNLFGVQRIRIDAESMILRGNHHLACSEIFDRLIGPSMSEFQFEGFSSESQTKELMPQTDPKNWFLSDQVANHLNGIGNRFGVAWPIRQNDSVRPIGKDQLN